MLGVCYYPEQWPRKYWVDDARHMRALGIQYVRIGEFAWAVIEPRPGKFHWDWLDEALVVLEKAGLKVVLGTPTAAPPKWLVDKHPEVLPVDQYGRVRNFGSRRHYCFSSSAYRWETERIVSALAERYGDHPAAVGWQLDNEYGCRGTVRCYCAHCRDAFRRWLKDKYGSIDVLNEIWGTVFWSQRYRDFSEIELPNLTVARPNPSHLLDYYRFASHRVREYNVLQANIIRAYSPGRFLTHNFENFSIEFNHFMVGMDLDFASWDSYPIGTFEATSLSLQGDPRIGDPDMAAFHHDLYRMVGRGRFWVMEQQVGPLNWGRRCIRPVPGAVRMWTWEAFAHGAEVVSFFRWRQVPYGAEQMHSGLLLPDGTPGSGYAEVEQVGEELDRIELPPMAQAQVALVFDYEAAWVQEVEPHVEGWSYPQLVLNFYRALRLLDLDVDVVPPGYSLVGYKLVAAPTLPVVGGGALESFRNAEGVVVFGPRSGSKTAEFHIPSGLPPGSLRELVPVRVLGAEGVEKELVKWDERRYPVSIWREYLEGEGEPFAYFGDGAAAAYRQGRYLYLGFWPPVEFLLDLFEKLANKVRIPTVRLPDNVRLRSRGRFRFAFNYSRRTQKVPAPHEVQFILGSGELPPSGVAIWEER